MKSWNSYFTRRELLALSAILLLSLTAAAFAGYRIIYLQESNRINESIAEVIHDVDRAISDARNHLNTIGALHNNGLTGQQPFSEKYASILLEDSAAIQAVGHFKRTLDGALVITDVVSDLNEMSSVQGFDFSTNNDLSLALPEVIKKRDMAAVASPKAWPDAKNLLVVFPAYQYVSAHPGGFPQVSFEGGYWLTFSFDEAMDGTYSDPSMANVGISLRVLHTTALHDESVSHDSLPHKSIFEAQYSANRAHWFSFLFNKIEFSRHLMLGNGSVFIKISGQPAFTTLAVMMGATIFGMIILMFLVCLSVVLNRRRIAREKLQALREVTRERAKAQRALNSISESVVALDDKYNVTYLNNAAVDALKTDAESAIGGPISSVAKLYDIENSNASVDVAEYLTPLQVGETAEVDVMVFDKNHVAHAMQLSMTNASEHSVHSARYTLVLRDVSAERALTRELEFQANHDSLTGVWNRYYFENRLKSLVESARRKSMLHALVYMDLDQFKIVNDTCGHTAGDRLLRELTNNLSAMLRPGDVLARLGGDEFGLLVVNTPHKEAVQVAERVYAFFQNSVFYHEGKAFPVRASIGFVPINMDSGSVGDIMSAADIACYTAKDSGRNSLNMYSEDNAHIAQRHQDMNWLPRLQTALKEDHFELLVQGVANTKTKMIRHYEFLLRLRRIDGSVVTPIQFIQAAERYDLMKDIDRWVISAAMQKVAEHRADLGNDCSFSINISGQSAADPSIFPFIENCLEQSGIPASCIWFEITETAAITHFQVAVELFQKLRELGAKVALDDFGSGLSSFGYLKNIPVDVIKIDGQFVKNLENDQIDREMVRAIHKVAETMGIQSVAEFVESEESLLQLAKIGVDLAQGYYIGHPCRIEDAVQTFQNNGRSDDQASGFYNAA